MCVCEGVVLGRGKKGEEQRRREKAGGRAEVARRGTLCQELTQDPHQRPLEVTGRGPA